MVDDHIEKVVGGSLGKGAVDGEAYYLNSASWEKTEEGGYPRKRSDELVAKTRGHLSWALKDRNEFSECAEDSTE